MAFFLINVENNFLFDQIFQTQTLENEENIFWKFFYAETKCLYYNKYDVWPNIWERERERERWLTVRNQNKNGKNNDHYIESQIFYFDPSYFNFSFQKHM